MDPVINEERSGKDTTLRLTPSEERFVTNLLSDDRAEWSQAMRLARSTDTRLPDERMREIARGLLDQEVNTLNRTLTEHTADDFVTLNDYSTAVNRMGRISERFVHDITLEDLLDDLYPPFRKTYRAAMERAFTQDKTVWQELKTEFARINNNLSGELSESNDPEVVERKRMQHQFGDTPRDDNIWNTVVEHARQEEVWGEQSDGDINNVSIDDLTALATQVRAEPDPIKRYTLVAQKAPNGLRWFDILPGFSSPNIDARIAQTAVSVLPDGQDSYEHALDMGAGTGNLTAHLTREKWGKPEPVAKHITALDRVPDMLRASHTDGADTVDHVVADMLHTPFPDGSFDLITSGGVVFSLDKEKARAYYAEIARLLEDGGLYLDGHYADDKHPESRLLSSTWKHVLADMIVDTVSGRAEKQDYLSDDELHDVLAQNGLAIHNGYYRGDSGKNVNIRMITKKAHFEKRDFSRPLQLIKD